MHGVPNEKGPVVVTGEDLKPVLEKAGLQLSEPLIQDFSTLLTHLEAAIDSLPDDKTVQPRPDLQKYPRSDIHIPAPKNSDFGAWATKVTARCTEPTKHLLQGRTIALKDNIALAGVRCTNGTAMVDWVPEIDATVATRIMDAGGIITGKAACENACMEGLSATSVTGPIHNPYAHGYSAGGSSSGCGRLVATGSVDFAVGCDQGGSIRIPASACGIVGLKPTWGLVPYTGILSLDATLDHAGPMAKNVRDCALLLDVLAGPDGWDDRQPPAELGRQDGEYLSKVDAITRLPKEKMLDGVKIGILTEGFEVPDQDEGVVASVRSAVAKFSELGAAVTNVSVPKHKEAPLVWVCSVPLPSGRTTMLGESHGRKQLYHTDRSDLIGARLTQAQFDALGPGASNLYVGFLWVREKYGPKLHGKCLNLLKAISDAYDLALKSVDVLITPTLSHPPAQLPEAGYQNEGLLKFMGRTTGILANTCSFNSTGHPALSLPVGFAPAREDPNVRLPVGMQIIGRKHSDIDCLKVAAAWEKAFDWKTL